jgi:hypothetical protein
MKNLVIILALVCIPVISQAQFHYDDENDSSEEQTRQSSLALHKQKTLDKIGAFKFEQRVLTHASLDALSKQLWKSKQQKILKSIRSKEPGARYFSELIDKDGDDIADMVAYPFDRGGETEDFAFIYDLNKDGNIDYIVFYQGVGFAKGFKIVISFYHWIDSNYDGRIDIWVEPVIDQDDDGIADEGVYAWLSDSSGDGRIEKAEHAGADIQQSIDAEDGIFKIKGLLRKEIEVGHEGPLKFANHFLSRINSIINE